MKARVIARSTAVVLGTIGFWQVATVLAASPVWPPPSTILGTMMSHSGGLLSAMVRTSTEAAFGFLVAVVLAAGMAASFLRWSSSEHAVFNVALVLHSVPFVAAAPILVIWLGNGYAPKVVLVALASFFPILVNATRGLRSMEEGTAELFHVLGASWWETFRRAQAPGALPYLLAGLKIAAPSAVLGAIISEWVGAQNGLGYQILNAMFGFAAPMLWASMAVSALLASGGFLLFGLVERLTVARWASDIEPSQ